MLEPRLSWKLQATDSRARGARQKNYQILVASTAELLKGNHGDLWDSGAVESDESVNIAYGGRALTSGQECFWKVRVADGQGTLSAWSEPARWTMGLLNASDWSAKWIAAGPVFKREPSSTDNTLPDPWLRKTFELKTAPARATAYVASIGYHELYVNGRKVGDDVLAPCATDHRHRARYVTYEIAKYLKPGRNVIGLWLGVSWSIFPPYQTPDKPAAPIVMAQFDLTGKGGSQRIVTDETWKTRPSPNRLLGVWDFTNFGGELYDARQELPNWSAAEVDDSAWAAVTLASPKVTVSAQKCEPNRLVKEIEPKGIIQVTNGTYRVDMGVNFAGWFQMELNGQPGDRVEFQFSERENEPMTHRLHSAYIIGPSGKGTFRNRFNYGVGRWVRISGLSEAPTPRQIRGWLVRTDYRRAAGFHCDQPLLNRIYDTAMWTFENLSLGGYVVDCPQRERMGYGGDAHATTRTALNNYDLGAFYSKWIEDWRDVQGADGNLPYTSPTYWGGGGPGWSGYCITLPWEIYQRYGDTRILEQNFPMLRRWLAFLDTKSENDQLKRWGGEWDFLGDWLWPGAQGVNGDTRETLFYNNCYRIYNLQTAAKIAAVLGKSAEADGYRKQADAAKAAVHAKFFNADDHSYVNGFPAYLAIALLVELPPQDLRAAVWRRLEKEILVVRKGHIHAGITGGAFLFKTLIENHRDDLIHVMLNQEDYPGWGDMLQRGATTFYEDWECSLSYLHSSYLYPGSWFIESLGGIRRADAAGVHRFVIEPWIDPAKGPRAVQAHYDSLYGRIATDWSLQAGQLRLRVTVPANTEATVRLPKFDAGTLLENGRKLDQVKGVVLAADGQSLQVQSGEYNFEAQLAAKP